MSAHVDRRELTESQPLDPQRAKQREVQRRLSMVAHRLDGLEERHIKIVFDVLGKALDWFDRKTIADISPSGGRSSEVARDLQCSHLIGTMITIGTHDYQVVGRIE